VGDTWRTLRQTAVELVRRGLERDAVGDVGIDEVPDSWSFDLVLTVCDAANESCPAHSPARHQRIMML